MTKPSATLAILAVALTAQTACSPQDAVNKIMLDKGLNLISPLRTYIDVGGLLFVPRNGRPYYINRLDEIPEGSTLGPSIQDFGAVFAAEASNQSADIGVVLKGLTSLIGGVFGASATAKQDVTLAQLTATGRQLQIPAARGLIAQTRTQNEILLDMQQDQARAYIVYEVYSASSISLRATTGADVAVALGSNGGASSGTNSGPGNPGANSSAPAGRAGSTDAAAAGSGGSTGQRGGGAPATTPTPVSGQSQSAVVAPCAPAAVPTATSNQPNGTSSQPTGTGSQSGTATGRSSGASTSTTSPAQANAMQASVTASWNKSSTWGLTLCGQVAYPFSVRLAEITKNKLGLLELHPGSFSFKGALNGTDVERFTAFVDESAPVVQNLTLRQPRGGGK
jgi:hypothetical protein